MSFNKFNKTTVTIVFVGDIMLHPDQLEYEMEHNWEFEGIFDEIKPIFKKADAVIGNLETTFSGFKELPEHRAKKFIAPDEFASVLKKVGFTHLNLCNNHMFDGEFSGFERTKQVIKNARMTPIVNQNYFLVKDQVVELLNFTTHLNPSSVPSQERNKYKEYKFLSVKESDIRIAFPHWGGQYNPEPDEEQIEIGNYLTKKNYNIIGSGPHSYHETIKNNKLIAYSLGDFLSALQKPDTTDEGKILSITFDNGEIKSYKEYKTKTVTSNGKSIIKLI